MREVILLRTPRVLYSGVSGGTERSFLLGGSYGAERSWPKRVAYQHVSEVAEVGAKIARFKAGDIVFSSTFPGHVEYHVVRESDLIVKLPEGSDPVEAALLGVASVAFTMHTERECACTSTWRAGGTT